jgi:DNA repair photolyase
MNAKYSSMKCKTALSPSRLPGLKYSLNPYLGCEHGCAYCYSPSTFRDEWMGLNWGKFVRAKNNIVEVLEHEVTRKPKGTAGVSTVTDPYQPLEAKLELTRKCIEILSEHDFPVSIQTKSSLVLRDADLISPEKFDVGVTITTMDRGLASKIEPRASPPDARVQVLDEFSSRGVKTWIFLGPIIPEVNDGEDSLGRIIEIAGRTKSRLMYDKLNLKRWVLDRAAPLIEQEIPGLAERLPALLSMNSEWWRKTYSAVESICKELGVQYEPAFPT